MIILNTLSGSKEESTTFNGDNHVRMLLLAPAVFDYLHVKTCTHTSLLRLDDKALQIQKGVRTNVIVNITDVDAKIFIGATMVK